MNTKKFGSKKNTPVRSRIVNTTLRLFSDHGIQTVGVDRIANEAEVAKMTLYSYFPSKNDLIFEYLQTVTQQWFEQLEQYVGKNSKNDYEKILAAFNFLKFSADKSGSFRGIPFINAANEFADPRHPLHGEILEKQEKLRQLFEKWTTNCVMQNCRQLSYSLLMIFYGAAIAATSEQFSEPYVHAIKTAEHLLNLHRN